MEREPLSGAERRKYLRFAPPLKAELEVPRKLLGAVGFNRGVPVRVMDLCEGGAGVFAPEPIDKGTFVRLKIRFEEMNDELDLSGQVVRLVPPPPVAKDWIIGVEFSEISKQNQRKITAWRNYVTSTMVRKKNDDRRKELGLDGAVPPTESGRWRSP